MRAGIPTASRFDSIITPITRKLSKAAESYALELVAERIIGEPLDSADSGWTSRGSEMEAEARRWYEWQQDVTVERVAFCKTDDGAFGCSPDGMVGDDGLVEFKCPSVKVHIGHLMGRSDPATPTQAQGQLWVTGRKWVDTVSFCPNLPPVLLREHRDETWMAAFDDACPKFLVGVEAAEKRIRALGTLGRIEGFGDDNDGLMDALYASLNGEPHEGQ